MCGNEACAEGAVLAGCRFYAGYPITPQNELIEYMSRRMPQVGGVFIQSESEIAAINMVFGASAAGARAMTSSSGPGISLKQEGISYLAGCELPAVIVNVMRGGPGLGNIAPSQADYFQATRGGGHGDYRCIILAPSCVQEMLDLTQLAFELADRYRLPTMILSDGLLGQMMEPVYIRKLPSKGCNSAKRRWRLDGCRGRRPRIIRSLLLKEGALEAFNNRLKRRYDYIYKREVRVESWHLGDAEVLLIGYGSVARTLKSVVKRLRQEGIRVGLFRPITLWPFPYRDIALLARRIKAFFVIEMCTGQMVEDVRLGVGDKSAVMFYGRPGGGIPQEAEIISKVRELLRTNLK